MECKTFSHLDSEGEEILKYKVQYETFDNAMSRCIDINNYENQLYRVVPYKCSICEKFHVGTSDNPLPKK